MTDFTSKEISFPDCIGEDGPMTPEQCAQWLDAKYARHGELEDKASAQMIRQLVATCQGMREDYGRLRAALRQIDQDEFQPNPNWGTESWEDGYWRVVNVARTALRPVPEPEG